MFRLPSIIPYMARRQNFSWSCKLAKDFAFLNIGHRPQHILRKMLSLSLTQLIILVLARKVLSSFGGFVDKK